MKTRIPKATKSTQLKEKRKGASLAPPPLLRKVNNTGMPDQLKSGIENLSGIDMSDVKVHYNSSQPAQLNAHAYAQGNQIHIAPGQEKHLPHEAWHVVQQKQGRVKPTKLLKGKVNINDNAGLEKEADQMGIKAAQMNVTKTSLLQLKTNNKTVQLGGQTNLTTPGLSGHTGGSQVNPILERVAAEIRQAQVRMQREGQRRLSPSENQAHLNITERELYIAQHKPGIVQQLVFKLRALQPPNFGDPPPGFLTDEQIRNNVDSIVTSFVYQYVDYKKAFTILWEEVVNKF